MRLFLSILCTGLILLSCAETEKLLEESADSGIREELSAGNADDQTLISDRIQLSDRWYALENKIPEEFTEIPIEKEVERDPFKGYRIQIFSGQDVIGADTVAANFRAWADTTISNYVPETYVFFKTPYYRVHVGDFYDRERAYRFSNVVKRAFRGAWVVYDEVQPNRVLPDTTRIMLMEADTVRAIR